MNQALQAEQMAFAPGFPSPFLASKPPGVAIRRSSSMFRQWVCRLSLPMYFVDAVIGDIERFAVGPWFGQQKLGLQYELPNIFQCYEIWMD